MFCFFALSLSVNTEGHRLFFAKEIRKFGRNWWGNNFNVRHKDIRSYCWWKKSQPTTWDVQDPLNTGYLLHCINWWSPHFWTINSINGASGFYFPGSLWKSGGFFFSRIRLMLQKSCCPSKFIHISVSIHWWKFWVFSGRSWGGLLRGQKRYQCFWTISPPGMYKTL